MLAPVSSTLYREYFTPAERRMLDASPLESALSEIHLYRALLRRLLAAAHKKRSLSLGARLAMLSAVSHAGLILASLVRFTWASTDHTYDVHPLLAEMAVDRLEDL
jgi:hypothetical protein